MKTIYAIDRPVLSNRIYILDTLRGFALLGIAVVHFGGHFLATVPPPSLHPYNPVSPSDFSALDILVDQMQSIFFWGIPFPIFSLLFGISFFIQMDQTAKIGQPFVWRMVWRLVVLFGIGYVHSLFYTGDVLMMYAVLGLLLIPLRRARNWVLLGIGLFFTFNMPWFLLRVGSVLSPPNAAQVAASKAFLVNFMKLAEVEYYTKQNGSLADIMSLTASIGVKNVFFGQFVTGRMFISFGLFVLGLWVGRQRLFTDTPNHRAIFRSLLLISSIIAILSTAIWAYLTNALSGWAPLPGWQEVFAQTAYTTQWVSLTAVYIAGVTLLIWHKQARFLQPLILTGRMGLTLYIGLSIVGALIYMGYGLGQLGKLGMAASVGLGIITFGVFTVFANRWFVYYQYGPIEWLWRTLTHWKIQPWRRKTTDLIAA
ncbi:DUF418 domain-containing protein [Spirosoma aerolatum]|uniref:DUF418 domain-containing protein n=1 Tax=Spirosoma aerolatum TaxID=1211326 RepID=UPI0009AD1E4F|nr:DUF418 domain-containing protein [Spirosoma aerolatum]